MAKKKLEEKIVLMAMRYEKEGFSENVRTSVFYWCKLGNLE